MATKIYDIWQYMIYDAFGGTAAPYGSYSAKNGVNTVVDTEFTTLLASDGVTRLKMSAKKFQYDYNGELLKTIEYDWFPNLNDVTYDGGIPNLPSAVPASAEILRVTTNSYYNSASIASDPTAYHKRTVGTSTVILGKLKETTVGPTVSSIKSHTKFSYDAQPFDTAPTKGNLTEVSAYNSAGTGSDAWLETVTTYTSRGNVETVTDPKLNVTQITYGSVDGVSTLTDLYPTQTIQAAGTSVARTSAAKYDFATGLPVLSTDVDNNNLSVKTTYDILGRPVLVENAYNTALESETETQYFDSDRRVVVLSDFESLGDRRQVSIQHFDKLGRVVLSRKLEDAATQDPADPAQGIKVETKYKTENGFTYQLTSNPYRVTNEATMGWTRLKAWSTGRRSEVETFTSAALPEPWGTNAASTGVVKTELDANATTVTDQAGKMRRSITNAIGHLKTVDEPTSAGLGSISAPNQPTVYAYDVLNNLLTVTQNGNGIEQCGPSGGTCSQTRNFAYSSLSRLTSATNPESGTINYGYDPNGNLATKVDARGVKTDYVYDQLNRVTNRNYSVTGSTPSNYQASPNVTYTYCTSAPAIGKLTKVSTGDGDNLSTTEYVEFDILGRVKRSIQKTDNITYGGGTDSSYWMTYSYNLSGALIEQQYPSGRRVKNILDADGELATVQSKKDQNHAYWNYANRFTYNAAGAVTSIQLGNGRWESTTFNSRLQPTQIALGKTGPTVNGQGQTVNSTELLKLDYQYGDLQWDGSVPTTTNNGNVAKQTIKVEGVGTTPGFTAVQNYDYDQLNRIQIASETLTPTTGTPESWVQEFKYDRFGNRKFNEQTTTTLPKECGTAPNLIVCPDDPKTNPSANPNTNKLIGYTFDPAGNTKLDTQSRKFYYDGENKQMKVIKVNASEVETAKVGEYWYDGDGRRIKKRAHEDNVPTEETIFVYDAFGKLIGEYSNQVTSSEHAKVAYLTNDHLGSPRINTDVAGNVTARHDYHPFGDEVASLKRVPGIGYGDDIVRKQFAGYERDNETELDFVEARMYANGLGRFTTSDPVFMKKDRQLDPQRLNLYIYVRNSPVMLTDPTGSDLTFELSFKQNSKTASNLADAKKYVRTVEKATGLKLALNEKTGLITIKEAPKNLSPTALRIDGIIGDSSASVKIAVSNNDKNVLGGQYDGNGHQTIDFADQKKLSKSGGSSLEGAIIHETVEAYEGLKNGNNFTNAHQVGIDAENEVRAAQGLGARVPGDNVISKDPKKGTITFETDYTTHTEQVTVNSDPNPPGYTGDIVNVKVKKKP